MKNLLQLLFLFSCILFYSQTITGKIENISKETINFANIIIKESSSDNISEFVIARNGQFSIRLKKDYSKINVEVTVNNYVSKNIIIENPEKNKTYTVDFVLEKENIKEIEEVVIQETKKKPFIIKEDTVKYNVAAYSNGSERKIQDIIKKLPGVEVNEKSGEIKYKGKPIETVTLEGDDLFGANYSIGTKNINVGIVEQVQAIENYSNNPLLKGIENDDKVALNLKLKKGKVDFSGTVDYGSGFAEGGKQMHDIGSNILGISKYYKSFGIISYNNVGTNNSPFDYFAFNNNVDQINEGKFFAKKIIPETFFSSELDDSRININNNIFGNYNSIFKIGKKVIVKTNLYYLQDKITSTQLFENNNLINENQFTTSDNFNIIKKPIQYRGDFEIKYNTSKFSLLEYKFKISQENITTPSSVIQNNENQYETKLVSNNFFLKNEILFTQKLSKKKALQATFIYSTNNIPQSFTVNPSVFDAVNSLENRQYSRFKKVYFNFQSTFLGSTSKTNYAFSIGGFLDKNSFQSELNGINNNFESLIFDYQNDLNYRQYSFFTLGSYNLNYGRWKITPSYSVSFLNQNLLNNIETIQTNRRNTLLEPSFKIKFKIDDVSLLIGNVDYKIKPNSEEYLYYKPILTSNRILQFNDPNLNLQKTFSYGLFYLINDLYKQFQLNVGANYSKNNGNFFSNINVQEDNTLLQYFYLPQSTNNINFNFMIGKYIPLFESTIRLKTNYTIFNYKNIVNNSDLRSNENRFLNSELFIKTAFDIKINFENNVKFNQIQSQSDRNQKFTNHSFNDTFKIIFKPQKQWFILLSSDYFVPNTNKMNEDYLFFDGSIKFTPKNKRFEISVIAKNILNKNNFRQVQTSDYSISVFQTNLIPRYFMLDISYNL